MCMSVMYCFFFLMIRRPPRSTRTDTLFPYTTLFRSNYLPCNSSNLFFSLKKFSPLYDNMKLTAAELGKLLNGTVEGNSDAVVSTVSKIEDAQAGSLTFLANPKSAPFLYSTNRSEERRVGKECFSKCRSRWWTYT